MRESQTNDNTNVCLNAFTNRERSQELRRNVFLQLSLNLYSDVSYRKVLVGIHSMLYC